MSEHYNATIVKIIIICFWIVLCFGFLYTPLIFNYFVQSNTLNIITYSEMIDPDYVEAFEKQHNVKIQFSYFIQNEELLLKLRATKGSGYDLVVLSDYVVKDLINEDLIRPLDKSRLNFIDRIIEPLRNLYCDPEGKYTLPFNWGIYGLTYNKDFFKGTPRASWDLIYKKPVPFYRVTNMDNPRELVLITAQYLFQSIDNLHQEQYKKIKDILIEQKEWIEAYTEFRGDYLLLSEMVAVAVLSTPYALRVLNIDPAMGFLIPQEGTFQIVDTFVLPKGSTKDKLIYEFLNFMYSKESIKHHAYVFPFLPATKELKSLLKNLDPSGSIYNAYFRSDVKIEFFRDVIGNNILNEIWIAVMGS